MKKTFSAGSRLLSVVLALAMILALAPLSAFAEGDGGSVGTGTISTGQAILDLDKTQPDEYNRYNTNVYGTSASDKNPFLLSEQNELFLYRADYQSVNTWTYDGFSMESSDIDSSGAWVNTLNKNNTSCTEIGSSDIGNGRSFRYVQAVSFDPLGTGRRDHVAYIGYVPDDKLFYVKVQNAKTGATVSTALTSAAWIHANADGSEDPHPFEIANYVSITAGDYNHDGCDTVIVYAAGDGTARIFEITYSGFYLSSSVVLDLDDYLVYKDWKTTTATKKKPVVSLTTGDFDGDGVEEFAYSAGFYNASGDVDDGWNGAFGDSMKHFASYVQMVDGSTGWTATDPVWMFDRSSTYTQEGTTKTYSFTVMHAAAITAADTDGNGVDEIVACGYKSDPTVEYENDIWSKVNKVCDWDKHKYAVSVVSYSGGLLQKKALSTLSMSKFFDYQFGDDGYNDKRYVFPKISMSAGKVDSGKSPDTVFIAGILYSFESGTGQEVFTPLIMTQHFTTIMNSGTHSEVMYVGDVAVGNFDGNDAGREQFAYTLWFMESGVGKKNHVFLDVIGGSLFNDEETDGEITAFGTAQTYGQTYMRDGSGSDIWSNSDKASRLSENSRQSAAAVPVAVDVDEDGLLAKFTGAYYSYSDPEVIAVLQAAPYFDELGNVGTTSYTITNGYGRTSSKGWEISFGVGFAGELQVSHFKVGLELGVTNSFSKTYSDSYTVSQSSTIETGKNSVVVLTRIPIMTYIYQLYDPIKKTWHDGENEKKNIYSVSVPLTPTMFSLTIDAYNAFVETYNNTTDGVKLIAINDKGGDLPADHEGDPFNYWKDWGECGGTKLSLNPFHLDKSNTVSTSEWSLETGHEEEYTHSHGLHFSLTMQGGIGDGATGGQYEMWLGGYAELDTTWSFGYTKTTFSSRTASGSVENLDPNDPDYEFFWDFGTWERVLSEEAEAVPVPFYGYHVYSLSAPAKAPESYRAAFETDETGKMVIELTWKDGGTVNRPTGSFILYQYQEDGSRTKIAEISAGDAQYMGTDANGDPIYRYVYDGVDGRASYEFALTAKGTGGATTTVETECESHAYAYVEYKAIYSIELTGSDGVTDTYTVSYTDGTVSYLYVKNGVSIRDVSLTSAEGLTDTYTITLTDGSSTTFTVRNGQDGQDGQDGQGIASIEKTGSSGLTDTYTITYTDGSSSTYTVTNGAVGADG